MTIPNCIVHYHLPDKKPFLNLSDLSAEEMKPIVADLEQRRLNGEIKRGFPDWYFPQRKEAEQNLLKAYIAKGGQAERKAPHYFMLGRSAGLEWGYNNNFKTVELPVELLKEILYFSLGDSLWTFAKSHTDQMTWENNWYHGKLYTYQETIEVIAELQLDLADPKSLNTHKVPCIEALVWSNTLLNEALKTANYEPL